MIAARMAARRQMRLQIPEANRSGNQLLVHMFKNFIYP